MCGNPVEEEEEPLSPPIAAEVRLLKRAVGRLFIAFLKSKHQLDEAAKKQIQPQDDGEAEGKPMDFLQIAAQIMERAAVLLHDMVLKETW